MIVGETDLHCFSEYYRVVSTDQSLNEVLKKNNFSCLKVIVPKDRDQTNKEQKFATERQATFPSMRKCLFYTTEYRWNCAISPIYS